MTTVSGSGKCEEWFYNQPEAQRALLLLYREIIMSSRVGVEEVFKFGAVFYCYKGPIGYLANSKKEGSYFGVIRGLELMEEFPELTFTNQKHIRLFRLVDDDNSFDRFNEMLEWHFRDNDAIPKNWHNKPKKN